ncbi:MAG: vanadium-dependent haloperoxidase [Fimbriimonadaceae bacterium]|nr:vanadium-dependent haloperoxidase [Fimbriimonadaceae bacterium]QYK55066.1 MAG: vanadium-dependent haloperoxidase [Fimbriimonadaceae bacterium]
MAQFAGRALVFALAFSAIGCGGSSFQAAPGPRSKTVVVLWNEALLQAIRDVSPGPTPGSRAIAIVHTAMYEAWAPYDKVAVGTRLGGSLRRPRIEMTTKNKEEAVSFAARRALADLFPTEKAKFDALLVQLGYDANFTSFGTTPAGIGNRAAQAVLDYRKTDGSNQQNGYADTSGYTPVNTVDTINDPNRWQPLRFSNGKAPGFLTPHWGNVRSFAITNAAALRPAPPKLYPDPMYKQRADEVLNLTANLTDKEKMIAEYWANGPHSELPPGHWCLFAQYVSQRDGHGIDEDVKMFFLVGNAVLDAGICCWESKRFYDFCRPITAIRFLYAGKTIKGWGGPGKGVVDMDGSEWVPYQPSTFITPPFAEYTSGHSTFSAASAEVLKRFTGSDRFGASVSWGPGQSTTEPGVTPQTATTLSWPTFSAAADEAGLSRRLGGIHFADGDLNARTMGREVGRQVWEKALTYFNGTAATP